MKSVFIGFFLLALATSALALTDQQKETLKKNHKICQSETNVDQAKVNQLRKGDFSHPDEDIQQYVFCMFRKSDLITEDGQFKKDVALSKVPADADKNAVEKAIDACINEKGATPHESAFLMAKCYHEQKPDHAVL